MARLYRGLRLHVNHNNDYVSIAIFLFFHVTIIQDFSIGIFNHFTLKLTYQDSLEFLILSIIYGAIAAGSILILFLIYLILYEGVQQVFIYFNYSRVTSIKMLATVVEKNEVIVSYDTDDTIEKIEYNF